MKKVLLSAAVAMFLVSAAPTSVWATNPVIKVQDPAPAPNATVNWFSYLVSLFH